ncbi:hypothetical protein ACKI1K_43920, partial [Streptomyces scabiei]|uniref:hypothetical protein n=1 Tax=Streptomyces scabiei TaxID=1930 RepID=UPI0038F76045
DAYSADRYNSWPAVAQVLINRGYNDRQVEAIMRSKWTRWANDNARNWRKPGTAMDVLRFIDNPRNNCTMHEVNELVRYTF